MSYEASVRSSEGGGLPLGHHSSPRTTKSSPDDEAELPPLGLPTKKIRHWPVFSCHFPRYSVEYKHYESPLYRDILR